MKANTWVYRTIIIAHDKRNRRGWIDTSRPSAPPAAFDEILAYHADAGWELISLNPERLRAITVPIGRYLVETSSHRAVFRRRSEGSNDA